MRVLLTPQRTLRKRARRLFRLDRLRWYCTADEREFGCLGELVDLGQRQVRRLAKRRQDDWYTSQDRFYVHRDNGSDILAVAHLDTVQGRRECRMYRGESGDVVASPTLDDRLGAYVICDLLPAMGIKLDWLLTTGEESCDSTAREFQASKPYNWIVSFDRGGTDVVMYEYETADLCDLVHSVNAPVGNCSYSDICDLEHLGVAGFNWGVGYRNYHSPRAYVLLADLWLNVGRFCDFHQRYGDTRLEHVARPKWWEADEWLEDEDECPACAFRLQDYWCDNCQSDWTDYFAMLDDRRYSELTEKEWRELEENVS